MRPEDHQDYRLLVQTSLGNQNPGAPTYKGGPPTERRLSQEQVQELTCLLMCLQFTPDYDSTAAWTASALQGNIDKNFMEIGSIRR